MSSVDERIAAFRAASVQVTAAVVRLEALCFDDRASFPDCLRSALTDAAAVLATLHGRSLTSTRPGCWEATHVEALSSLELYDADEIGRMTADVVLECAAQLERDGLLEELLGRYRESGES